MDILGTRPDAQPVPRAVHQPVVISVQEGDLSTLELGARVSGTVVASMVEQTVVEVTGSRIVLPALAGLNVGEQVDVRIVSRHPQMLVQISRSSGNVSQQSLPLFVGQRITAHIMEQLSDGRFLLDVGGRTLTAVGPDGLTSGMVLPLEVEQLQPQLMLLILGQEPELSRLAAEMLSARVPLRRTQSQSLATLRSTLSSFVSTFGRDSVTPSLLKLFSWVDGLFFDQSQPTGDQFVQWLNGSGLNYEAEVARLSSEDPRGLQQFADRDLKGLLLQAMQDVESSTRLAESILEQLNHIEFLQLVNILAQLHDGPFHFQIPVLGDEPSTAYLSIEPDEHGRNAPDKTMKAYNILLKVDLESLGETRVDAFVEGKRIRVIIYADRPQVVEQLDSALPRLETTLGKVGFTEVFLAAKRSQKIAPEKWHKFNSLADGIPESTNLINVKG